MKIDSKKNGTELTVSIEGSINAVTAADLEKELKAQLEGVTELTLDFTGVSFVSSAGIRVVLWAYKQMNNQITLKNVNENVREVFEMTGLETILNFA